jgi:hypothetical protein
MDKNSAINIAAGGYGLMSETLLHVNLDRQRHAPDHCASEAVMRAIRDTSTGTSTRPHGWHLSHGTAPRNHAEAHGYADGRWAGQT